MVAMTGMLLLLLMVEYTMLYEMDQGNRRVGTKDIWTDGLYCAEGCYYKQGQLHISDILEFLKKGTGGAGTMDNGLSLQYPLGVLQYDVRDQ
jgi:hypothetical protein